MEDIIVSEDGAYVTVALRRPQGSIIEALEEAAKVLQREVLRRVTRRG